jgi:hypothetical protein
MIRCFKRFDASFTGPLEKSASSATTSYDIDTNWYMYSSATDLVTGELEKLTVRDKYGSHDQVHSASEAGMKRQHIGSSKLCSRTSTFRLNTILHVPQASKSLVSVNHLTQDNNVFLEFYPNHFSMKEWGTRRTLLKGRCERGLYPLKPT